MKKILLMPKALLGAALLSMLMLVGANIMKALLLQKIIDSIYVISENLLIILILMVIGFIVYYIVASLAESYFCNKYVQSCMIKIKEIIFCKVFKRDFCRYREKNTSQYVTALTGDIQLLEKNYFTNLIELIESIIEFVLSFFVILKIHYIFIVFVVLTAWIPLGINKLLEKKLSVSQENLSSKTASFLSKIQEFFSGYETIITYNSLSNINEKYNAENYNQEKARFKCNLWSQVSQYLSGIASIAIWLGALLVGGFFVMRNEMTIGMVIAAQQLLNGVLNPIYRIGYYLSAMKASSKVIMEKMDNLTFEEINNGTAKKNKFKENILFNKVSWEVEKKVIINEIQLEIKKNKKYLVMGESGSGKSSILMLLMQFVKHTKGEILIDGINLINISYEERYRLMTLVQQKPFLFQDTIYNNITMYQQYSEEEYQDVISKTKLMELINKLPQKSNTVLAEDSRNFSGGEIQRIALARALLRKPSILLLDEITSALDAKTANEIEECILNMQDTTVINVSHNIDNRFIEKYDYIINVNRGNVQLERV